MVILGFRPKVESVPKEAGLKKEDTKVSDSLKKKQVPIDTSKPSNSQQKHHQQHQQQKRVNSGSVSSNWKRLQSLNVLTTKGSFDSASNRNKPVSDADWFGVKNVAEFAAEAEDRILRENVSTATLFPPPPSGISGEKLRQPCKFIALDCEMVGTGLKGFESILARVSVVNFHGIELMDVYVKPTRKVVDYRTAVSGVTVGHLTASKEDHSVNMYGQPLITLTELQGRLIPLLEDRIVVGHALNNDFAALLLSSNHPRRLIRDTSRYTPFRALANGRSPSLKMLAAKILGVQIQTQSHDSVDDARIAMLLYRSVKAQWENDLFTRKSTPSSVKGSRRRNENDNENGQDYNNSDFIFDPNLQ